jgi:AAA15 family ATPase/GTPase
MQENKQEHFIKNIEIKNFKCFEDFKANGFGRVNLIGGKNNVGKTAFMEACFLSDALSKGGANFHSALFTIENNRKAIKDMTQSTISKILQKNSPIQLSHSLGNKVDLKFEDNDIKLTITTKEKVMSFKDVGNPELYIKLLSSFISSTSMNCSQLSVGDKLLNILYDGVKRNRKREELNTFINEFDNDLIEIDIIENDFEIFSKSQNRWVSISDYGDGIKYYIAYLSAIWTYKNNIIFIDEIENGIHYTNLDKLWEIILTISKEQNVQVFATTHSKECIESYVRVSKKLEDEEITYTILTKLDDGSIDAGMYTSSMLINTINQEHEVRGW